MVTEEFIELSELLEEQIGEPRPGYLYDDIDNLEGTHRRRKKAQAANSEAKDIMPFSYPLVHDQDSGNWYICDE